MALRESAQRKNDPTACGRELGTSPLCQHSCTHWASHLNKEVWQPLFPFPFQGIGGGSQTNLLTSPNLAPTYLKTGGRGRCGEEITVVPVTELTSLSTHEGCCAECFTCSLSFTPHNIPLK